MTIIALAIAAILLAVERVAYAWAWFRPGQFRHLGKRCGVGNPVQLLERLFYVFKAIQLLVFTSWCLYFGGRTGWPETFFDGSGALGSLLIVAGQILNFSIFLRLGRVGVFYGGRYGHRIPWVQGFPFSLVAHPQYVGTALSIWGLFLLVRFPEPDWLLLPLLQTVYYAASAWSEEPSRIVRPHSASNTDPLAFKAQPTTLRSSRNEQEPGSNRAGRRF